MIRKVLVGICAFSLMYSCSKDDVLPADDPDPDVNQVTEGDPVAAVFVSSFVKQDWVGPNGPETRVWDDQWTGGEEIGIYMIKKSDEFDLSKAMFKNKKYTVKASAVPGDPPTGEIDYTASDKMYYPPKDATKVQFVAYCPYDASDDNMAVYTFTDQDTQAGKEAADFIFHKGTKPEDEYSNSPNTPVQLKFKHKFSKIRIEVVPEEGSDFTIEDLTATLTGIPASATVDLKKLAANENDVTAAIAYGEPGPIKPYIIGTPTENKVEFEVIVPPHSGTGTGSYPAREFKFNNNGEEWNYPLPTTATFASGNEYKYKLTLLGGAPLDMSDGLTNCYLVKPGDPVTIPITRAITVGRMPASTATEAITLVKYWDEGVVQGDNFQITGGTGNDREFTVNTNNVKGNAVILLKIGNTIYWSWHIWAQDPDEIETWTYTGSPTFTVMDRCIGAPEIGINNSYPSVGLFYQWGRKDPFPFANIMGVGFPAMSLLQARETAVKVNSERGAARTVLESIRNPLTFFIGTPHDWLPYSINTLWNTTESLKSVYDPCPEGYRVPHHDNILGEILLNSGFGWARHGFWQHTGGWYNPNTFFFWSAVTSDEHWNAYAACEVNYHFAWWQPANKAVGATIRCIQE